MRCKNCNYITYVEIENFYEPDKIIDGKFVEGTQLLGRKFSPNNSYLCITCENKQRYNHLPDDQKALLNMYENTIQSNNNKSMAVLGELIKLKIDDVVVPK